MTGCFKKNSRFIFPSTILTVILLTVFILSCSPAGYSGNIENLTVAAVPTELNALVYVAEDQNLFAHNGLQVTFKDYDSGATAAAGMLKGEADIALAAEFPIVRQVFNKQDIIGFGTIARYENTFIIWRTDSGVKTIKDLKGKKIGVTLQTISEFYLGRTLDLNGMSIQQVTLVDTKAADSEKAIANGEVDAVVTWEPWVTQVNQHLGNQVITATIQSSQQALWNLASTPGWLKNHPEGLGRLIKSLVQAESYLAGHQDKAKSIVRNRMNFDEAYMDILWQRYQFSLSIDQSLIAAMEDEARWMISNNLTTEKAVPDFRNYIYVDALKSVKPESVNIIR
jgi:ABC-type nitrate/sulfonate/bicarbonate transport system substrate-binding protein